MRRPVILPLALAAAVLAGGCGQTLGSPAAPTASLTPQTSTSSPAITDSAAVGTPCSEVYNAVRCQTMTDWVASQLGTTREQLASLDVIPQPTPQPVSQVGAYSGGPPVGVRATLRDGSVHIVNLHCGVGGGVQCMDDPRLQSWSVMDPGGYYDGTEAQLQGGRPSIAPDAMAEGMSLRVTRLGIPIDHVGRYEVPLGEARLPNGILTAADFALVEPWPTGVSIVDGGVGLEIRSLEDGGKPILNIYQHGWHPGTERVEAVVVFDVVHFDPGATLGIKDIVVQ